MRRSQRLSEKMSQLKKSKETKRMVEEWKLPVLVMEKVFSCLDWKSLRTAMLVCKRWHEVDGHPSLLVSFCNILFQRVEGQPFQSFQSFIVRSNRKPDQ